MTGPVAIALSGGVDSLVAAHLLKREHGDLFGLHFLTGYENPSPSGLQPLRQLCRQLGIPLHVVDLKASFKTVVVDYFTAAYRSGQTPNPCLVCNSAIKFGPLLQAARQLGASHLATGHYARVAAGCDGRYRLCKGSDAVKDQSYFLARLNQGQLARAVFPLGEWTKRAVRRLAEEKGLNPWVRQESQDVCFIRDTTYADFLTQSQGLCPQAGDIVDSAGRRIGTHGGLHRYTVGQRRGINCPAGQPYYVVRLDCRHNRLVVGFKEELALPECRVTDINWIAAPPTAPSDVEVRLRYRHRPVRCTVALEGSAEARVRFEQPQAAVTPGQAAVFYRGERVLGGGWIV